MSAPRPFEPPRGWFSGRYENQRGIDRKTATASGFDIRIMNVDFGLRVAVNAAAIFATGFFLATMVRIRLEPTSLPLIGVGAAMFLGTIVHPLVTTLLTRYWLLSAYSTVVIGGGFWFLFALRYTGRGGRVTPLAIALVGTLFVVMLGIDVASATTAFERYVPVVNVVLNAVVLVLVTLMAIGVMLVVAVSYGENRVLTRGSILLSAGAAVLVFIPVITSKVQQPVIVPLMVVVASGLLNVAVGRYRIFGALPVVRIAGRDRIIEELDDAVIVVDRDDLIRDINPSAERMFDIERSSTLGRGLDGVLSPGFDPEDVVSARKPVQIRTNGSTLSVTARSVTDGRNRHFGYLLVCQDVTDRRNREDRLAVLNHLLTGAVHERMGDVAKIATTLTAETAAGTTRPEIVGDRIYSTTADLLTLVDRTREIERALAAEDSSVGCTDAGEIVRNVLDEMDDRTIDTEFPEDATPVSIRPALLRTTVETLVEDAIDHAAVVEITVEMTDDGVTIGIVDDRSNEPEFPEDERQFTSDVSIQLARLAVEHANGTVSVTAPDSGGRCVRLRLANADAGSEWSGSSNDRFAFDDTRGAEP